MAEYRIYCFLATVSVLITKFFKMRNVKILNIKFLIIEHPHIKLKGNKKMHNVPYVICKTAKL